MIYKFYILVLQIGIQELFLCWIWISFFYFRLLVARAAGGARGVQRSANVRTGGSAIPPTGAAAVPLGTGAQGTTHHHL